MPKSVSIGRPIKEGQFDEIDIKLLTLISEGYPNSFAIYRHFKSIADMKHISQVPSGTRTMVYKNVNRRVLLLVKAGVIEEVKYTERTPHGRIDYKLTMKGFEALLPYMLSHPMVVEDLVHYINYVGLDKKVIADKILLQLIGTLESVRKYLEVAGIDSEMSQTHMNRLGVSIKDFLHILALGQSSIDKDSWKSLQNIFEVRNKEANDLIKKSVPSGRTKRKSQKK